MDPIDEQINAYNARDLDRFVACYAPDAVIEDGIGNKMAEGREAMRALYGPLFEGSPQLHAEILTRIRVGPYVIDEEQTTGFNLEGYPSEIHAAVVYRVEDDTIVHARLLS